MDHLINGILELVAEFEQENLKDHIRPNIIVSPGFALFSSLVIKSGNCQK
mgnify:CR=1 FL=1